MLFNKTALQIAIEKNNNEIVELLLENKNIDINLNSILSSLCFLSHLLICILII